MKTLAKIAVALALVVVIAVGAAVFFLYSNLDEIVRRTTETVTAQVLGVDVSLGGANVDIGNRSVELTDFVIGNPQGFDADEAMSFGAIKVVVTNIQSFRTEEPVIDLIEITSPSITWEQKMSGSNLQQLIKNAQEFAGEDDPDAPEEAGKSYIIDEFRVIKPQVRVAPPVPVTKPIGATLPDIEMEGIGREKDSVTPAEFFELFLAEIMGAIGSVKGSIMGQLDGLSGEARRALEGGFGEFSNTVGDVQSALGDLTKGGIGGLGDAAGSAGETAREALGGVEGAGSGAAREAEKAADEARKAAEGAVRGIGGLLGGGSKDDEED